MKDAFKHKLFATLSSGSRGVALFAEIACAHDFRRRNGLHISGVEHLACILITSMCSFISESLGL